MCRGAAKRNFLKPAIGIAEPSLRVNELIAILPQQSGRTDEPSPICMGSGLRQYVQNRKSRRYPSVGTLPMSVNRSRKFPGFVA